MSTLLEGKPTVFRRCGEREWLERGARVREKKVSHLHHSVHQETIFVKKRFL